MRNVITDIICEQDEENGQNYLKCEYNEINLANGVYFCRLTFGKREVWEKIMIINPAIILKGKELLNKNFPKNVADAPNAINTIEKPIVNKIIGNKFIFFFSISSLKLLPVIKDI